LADFLNEELGELEEQKRKVYLEEQAKQWFGNGEPEVDPNNYCGKCRQIIPKSVSTCPYCGFNSDEV